MPPTTVPPTGLPQSSAEPTVVSYPFDGPPVPGQTAMISWADSMRFADDYVRTEGDNGHGHWQYLHRLSGCTVDFWQVRDPSEPGPSGERGLSDALIAIVSGMGVSAVSAKAGDDALPVFGAGGTFQTRSIYGVTRAGDAGVLYQARFFSGAHIGVVIGLRCPLSVDLSDSSRVPVLADVALAILGG